MKKKLLTLCLVVVLAFTAIIGTTLAYFTDTDKAVNTLTSTHVDITLVEQQRKYDNGNVTGLEAFENDKVLLPITDPSAQGEKDGYGMPVSENYADKIINVTNNEADAYVRVYVAVPAALDNTTTDAEDILHLNIGNKFNNEGKYKAGENYWNTAMVGAAGTYQEVWGKEVNRGVCELDGITYNVYSYTYLKVLTEDETTDYAAIIGCYLDKRVDYNVESGKYTFNGEEINFDLTKIKIPVFAIGTQAAGFSDADTALNTAFGENYMPAFN